MGRSRTKDFHLPERVYRRRGRLYLVAQDGTWLPLHMTDGTSPEVTAAADAVRDKMAIERHLKRSFSRISSRAKRKGVLFSLVWNDCLTMLERSQWRCEVSGLPFRLTESINRPPFAPSIDRIHGPDGYTAPNCRLVCVAVNIAMNEWGAEAFADIARAVRNEIKRRKRRVILAA